MARLLEIKGLSADVAGIKKGIVDLRAAASGLNTEKTALVSEIADLTDQIKQYRTDIRFEAEQLGNGGETSTEKSDSTTTQ